MISLKIYLSSSYSKCCGIYSLLIELVSNLRVCVLLFNWYTIYSSCVTKCSDTVEIMKTCYEITQIKFGVLNRLCLH